MSVYSLFVNNSGEYTCYAFGRHKFRE